MRKTVSYCRRRVFLSLRSNSARVTNLPIILKVLGDPTRPVGGDRLKGRRGTVVDESSAGKESTEMSVNHATETIAVRILSFI
jgi:hypothetical protein